MPELQPWHNWLLEAPAQGQLELVQGRLQSNDCSEPVGYLLQAMRLIGNVAGKSFFDAGCGVGGYGEWLARLAFDVRYIGCDVSRHMIVRARREFPGRRFFVADMREVDYSGYDIVLASGVLDMLPDWRQGARSLCQTVGGLLILHRMHIGERVTRRYVYDSYELPAFGHIFNEQELLGAFWCFDVLHRIAWTERPYCTYVLERGVSRW